MVVADTESLKGGSLRFKPCVIEEQEQAFVSAWLAWAIIIVVLANDLTFVEGSANKRFHPKLFEDEAMESPIKVIGSQSFHTFEWRSQYYP